MNERQFRRQFTKNEFALQKVCRGCLTKNGEMRPLYGSCLDKMLMTVAEVQVSFTQWVQWGLYNVYRTIEFLKKKWKVEVGDGLPEKMCVQCVLQVSRAFTFKQQCQRSDTTLRSYYQTMQETIATEATLTVTDEMTGTQSVEVQFKDPTNGEERFLVVQQISMMNADDMLVTFAGDNKIVGNVICQEDVVDTNDVSEPTDSLSEINFVSDDVIKLEDSSSLALVDVEDLESEIITDAYGKRTFLFFLWHASQHLSFRHLLQRRQCVEHAKYHSHRRRCRHRITVPDRRRPRRRWIHRNHWNRRHWPTLAKRLAHSTRRSTIGPVGQRKRIEIFVWRVPQTVRRK